VKVRATVAAVAWVFVSVVHAWAHEEVSGVRNVLEAVEPWLPGVTIQVRISVADQLLVSNPTSTQLVVLGEKGEPFLRFGPDGAFANLRSPTWYRSNDPTGALPVPPRADASATPDWALIAREPAWGWFDHRLHRVNLGVAPPSTRPITLERWEVPMRYGDRGVIVRGRREFRPVRGAFVSEVTEQIPGAVATILPGKLPGIFLRVTGRATVTLYETGNVPFARVGPKGAQVNEASATWVLSNEVKTGAPPTGAVGAGVHPRWRRADRAAQLAWLEPRTQYPAEEPPRSIVDARRTVVLRRWSIPVRAGGRRDDLKGTTSWVPVHPRGKSGTPWGPIAVAGVLVSLMGLAYIARRSKMEEP
jgi:hypothetical protein